MTDPLIDEIDIDERLRGAVERGDPPAAQCCVFVEGEIAQQAAHGCEIESVFDLASV